MAFPGHNRRVKRWIGACIAVVLSCLLIVFHRADSPGLLRDTDTKVLLATIRSKNSPFSWFFSDWPLHNHFYRPVSTLSFELDNRLYGANAAGYGLTNALLCIACVLLLFWFLRELTDLPWVSAGGAVLFALQSTAFPWPIGSWLMYVAIIVGVVGLIRHRLQIRYWLPAPLVLLYLGEEVGKGSDLMQGTIGWLPGRTATVMTVFALAAMAAYTRYERLGAQRKEKEPTPLDPPATRTTKLQRKQVGASVLWPIFSLICVALALASYEQAVMLPAVMLAIAVTMMNSRYRVRWGWQAGFWTLLVGYLILRKLVVPTGVSAYQAQQFRSGGGVRLSLLDYLLPCANGYAGFMTDLEGGLLMLMTGAPYVYVLSVATNLTAFYQAKRRWVWALAGYGMSFLAFLPMAWLKQFPHYSYWPLALRSLFTVMLALVAVDLTLIAWSPPTRQAPKRLDPAPGSLPHR